MFHPKRGLIMQTNMSGNIIFFVLASMGTKSFMCLKIEGLTDKEDHM